MIVAAQSSLTTSETPAPPGPWYEPMLQIYHRDPRKMTLIASVSVVMLGLSIHFVFHGPSTASASMSKTFASGNAETKLTVMPVTPPQEQAAPALMQWLNEPKRAPGRNLFAINLDAYPRQSVIGGADSHSGEDQVFWDEVAKSLSSQADHRKEQQNRVEILQRQAARLRLEKTTMRFAKVLVNGVEVQEGSIVASFRVLTIEPQRIVVEREGIRLEVPLH